MLQRMWLSKQITNCILYINVHGKHLTQAWSVYTSRWYLMVKWW